MDATNEPVYTQFRHNAKAAVAFLRQRGRGIAVAALHHPEIGDIDLAWGMTTDDARSKGFGLAKIIRWHPEAARDLQGFISGLHVHQRHGKKIHMRGEHGERAAIERMHIKTGSHWVLTAYIKGAALVDSLAAHQIETEPDSATSVSCNVRAPKGFPAALDDAARLTTAPHANADNFILGFEALPVNENTIMQTQLITYNLKERGRNHRGVERNFDVPKIAAAVNAPATQERVSKRDMIGFYGHWPRVKFGMNPAEGGIADGKAQAVEPALVTTHLKAFKDGTIEHKAEFLPTHAGELAWKLYNARTGGFSSAIDTIRPEFFGFDYVLEPNYSTNRGYALDSIWCEGGACALGMTCDDVNQAIIEEQLHGFSAMMDAVGQSCDSAAETIAELKEQNTALFRTLKELGYKRRQVLDSIHGIASLPPLIAPPPPIRPRADLAEAMQAQAQAFRDNFMPRVAPEPAKPADKAYTRMMSALLGG